MKFQVQPLRSDLVSTLGMINNLIDEVEAVAKEMKIEPWQVRDSSGGFVLSPLLVAKVQALHAIVLLQKEN